VQGIWGVWPMIVSVPGPGVPLVKLADTDARPAACLSSPPLRSLAFL
jgi:hypothetical protein